MGIIPDGARAEALGLTLAAYKIGLQIEAHVGYETKLQWRIAKELAAQNNVSATDHITRTLEWVKEALVPVGAGLVDRNELVRALDGALYRLADERTAHLVQAEKAKAKDIT
jgi:hypothetical protein